MLFTGLQAVLATPAPVAPLGGIGTTIYGRLGSVELEPFGPKTDSPRETWP